MSEETPPDLYCEELLVRTIIALQNFREYGNEHFDRAYVDGKSYYHQLDSTNKMLFRTICRLTRIDPERIADAYRRRRFS